jgi:hypothetical protein
MHIMTIAKSNLLAINTITSDAQSLLPSYGHSNPAVLAYRDGLGGAEFTISIRW